MESPVQQYLQAIADACAGTDGAVAGYIPELAAADPDRFAMCLATVDGQVYQVGDASHRYSIQSISKPFTYALALQDRGVEAVTAKVGVEPSGDAFNEISLAPGTGRPRNPMINAGAITAASLVDGTDGADRFDRVLAWYGRFAGRELDVDEAVYTSELATAHRNRGLAHLLREFDILTGDPEEVLDQYIRQCAVSVDTRDLALMAATLANGGVHPRGGEPVLEPGVVERVLSVMTTCGMYDAAGDWVSSVGMPAKSGVSGAIIGVLPGQVGVAVFSPRLDGHGNSSRGVTLFERMSTDMEMHLMHVSRGSRSAVRNAYSLAEGLSRSRRRPAEQDTLARVADRAMVYELHGDLLFAGAEAIVRTVVEDDPELAVFDFSHVNEIAMVSRRTLVALRDRMREQDALAVVVDPEGVLPDPDAGTDRATRYFPDVPAAIAWCEDELLSRYGGDVAAHDPVADHPLLALLDDEQCSAVQAVMHESSYRAGEVVLAAGGAFAGVHLIVEGSASARATGRDGRSVTLVVMGAGTSFGELALGTGDVQETEIVADSDLRLLVLPADRLERLTREQPALALAVWQAIARDGYRVADRALRRGAVHQHQG
ncbi:glutaminase A [Serinicoccus sp. LYQ131]|uniref:glutaminase A n=1 Tax=Serinicoccus sp. LYQ131 TaxID=3378797 RepID=UPI0038542164